MRTLAGALAAAGLFFVSTLGVGAAGAAPSPSSYTVQLLHRGNSQAQWHLTPPPGSEAPFTASQKVSYIGTQTETLAEHKDASGQVTSVSTVVQSTPAEVIVGTTGTIEPVPHQPNLVVVDVTVTKLDRLRTFRSGGLELQVPVTRQRVIKQVVTLKNGTGTVELPDDDLLRVTATD